MTRMLPLGALALAATIAVSATAEAQVAVQRERTYGHPRAGQAAVAFQGQDWATFPYTYRLAGPPGWYTPTPTWPARPFPEASINRSAVLRAYRADGRLAGVPDLPVALDAGGGLRPAWPTQRHPIYGDDAPVPISRNVVPNLPPDGLLRGGYPGGNEWHLALVVRWTEVRGGWIGATPTLPTQRIAQGPPRVTLDRLSLYGTLAVAQHGAQAFALTNTGRVLGFNTTTLTVQAQVQGANPPPSPHLALAAGRVLVTTGQGVDIYTRELRKIGAAPTPVRVLDLSASPRSRHAFLLDEQGRVSWLSPKGGLVVLPTLSGASAIESQGNTLLVARAGHLETHALGAGSPPRLIRRASTPLPPGNEALRLTTAAEGSYMSLGKTSQSVFTTRRRPTKLLELPVTHLAFASRSRLLIGSDARSLQVFDGQGKQVTGTLLPGQVAHLAEGDRPLLLTTDGQLFRVSIQ
jgi:hypothetical protein